MSAMASQITGVSIVCSTVGSGADQRKHQSSASLAFVWGIHRWPVNSPHKWPVTQKMFPIDDVITTAIWLTILTNCITLITDGDGRTDTARRKRERPMGSKRTWSAAVWQVLKTTLVVLVLVQAITAPCRAGISICRRSTLPALVGPRINLNHIL